jgi:hypothetical protein
MPKTIQSKRDPLTELEKRRYEYNKKVASNIREDIKLGIPGFDYCKIFTEARADGKCRTKFWLVNAENRKKALKHLKKHWNVWYVSFHEINPPNPTFFGNYGSGISITVSRNKN